MLPSREELFELWAPAASPWSAWAKPVAFAHLALPLSLNVAAFQPLSATDLLWAPAADGRTLVVADLPGGRSVRIAEQLARRGFRPVPLFNAAPGVSLTAFPGRERPSVVDVSEVMQFLGNASVRSGAQLRALPAEAPPIFLLHSERRGGRRPEPGDFDNRSLSLPTDFPSARFLAEHGIARVLLLLGGDVPQVDLAHTLLRWQAAGIAIDACSVDAELRATAPRPIVVARPSWFGALWHNALATVGLSRHPLGGFGGHLPLSSGG